MELLKLTKVCSTAAPKLNVALCVVIVLCVVIGCLPASAGVSAFLCQKLLFSGLPVTDTAALHVVQGDRLKKATFGAGCFWGVELTFQRIPGVV